MVCSIRSQGSVNSLPTIAPNFVMKSFKFIFSIDGFCLILVYQKFCLLAFMIVVQLWSTSSKHVCLNRMNSWTMAWRNQRVNSTKTSVKCCQCKKWGKEDDGSAIGCESSQLWYHGTCALLSEEEVKWLEVNKLCMALWLVCRAEWQRLHFSKNRR